MLHDSPSLLEALPGHPGNPRTRIEGESPPQEKGHTVFVAALLAITQGITVIASEAKRSRLQCRCWICFVAVQLAMTQERQPGRYSSGSASRLALPPAAAVLIVTVCSLAKRRR